MPAVKIMLPATLEEFIRGEVKSGRYTSASEVICKALEVLRESDAEKPPDAVQLRAKVAAGLEQLEAGSLVPMTASTMQRIRKSGRAKLQATKARPVAPLPLAGDIVPLKLYPQGEWDPAEEYWGDDGEPLGDWATAIIKAGPRPMFEMEQVLPGADSEDFDSDPILDANDLRDQGDTDGAKKLLKDLLARDIRCLDAHAHLGNLSFDRQINKAFEHYRHGVDIGELSLAPQFNGVLPWGMIDNRPFLRCLNGLALCLWRLNRFEEAERQLTRLLWMSPSDNLGVRFLLGPVRMRKRWTADGA